MSANLALDGRLTIFGYNKFGQQDRSYLGAIAEIKNGEYKFAGLPIGDEFDIFVTKNNLTDENNISNEKLILDDLIFIKDKTFKATETTFSAKSKSQSGQIIIVRKIPIQRVEFDFAGRIIASYDVNDNQTLYFYDSLGRQIAVVQPPSGKDNIRFAKENYFDLAGNTIAQIVVLFDKDTLKPIKFKKTNYAYGIRST
ncbi:MAG: hypothetical protein LBC74_13285 [Planctomycetaceae bacterium]|nr:hypothetical protein [Planctomycetaceae bacterium]